MFQQYFEIKTFAPYQKYFILMPLQIDQHQD